MTPYCISGIKVMPQRPDWQFEFFITVYRMFKERSRCTLQFSVFFLANHSTHYPVHRSTTSTAFNLFLYLTSLITKTKTNTMLNYIWGFTVKIIPLNTVWYSVYSHDVFEGKVLLWRVIFLFSSLGWRWTGLHWSVSIHTVPCYCMFTPVVLFLYIFK